MVGASGVAFFANNSVIDTTGCGGLNGVIIGSSVGYQAESYPPSAFFPPGATVPVIFFASSGASTAPLPGVSVALAGVLTGFAIAVVYDVARRRRDRT